MRPRATPHGCTQLSSAIRALGIVFLGVGCLTCGHREEAAPGGAGGPPVAVAVRAVEVASIPEIHELVGTVRPRIAATIEARVMAAVTEVLVQAGDIVHAGDTLALLDDRELHAEFERARADHVRFERLLRKEAATRAEYDAVQSRYRIAEAVLSHSKIVAPFDGVVTQKHCDAGDMAAPGKPLFTVEGSAAFRLEAAVPERFARSTTLHAHVDVVVDATQESCGGTIAEIVPAADPASRSFGVKIDLTCRQPLQSGVFARARLPVGTRRGLIVPRDVVHERGQLTYLFVASDGRARMRLVRVQPTAGADWEVLAGLQPGESVIVSAEGSLRDGQPIQAR